MFKKLYECINRLYDDYTVDDVYLVTLFLIGNTIWNVLYTILLCELDINEVAYVTTFNVGAFVLCLYLILIAKRIDIAEHIFIVAICMYVLVSSYFLGYDKASFVLLIPLIFAIHTFVSNSGKNFKIWMALIFLTFVLQIIFRYKVVSKYEYYFYFIEYINSALAAFSILYIIFAKTTLVNKLESLRQKQIERLEKNVETDFLTGLYNRRYIEKKLASEYNFEECYFILCDIDHFKKINDTYGHLAGDYVLETVADLMVENFRSKDIIARWGGEEFLIFIKNVKSYDILSKVEEMRSTIEDYSFEYNDSEIKVTMTFGVKCIDNNINIDENIAHADKSLYYGKEHGRNRVVYYEDVQKVLKK
ncbi:MAG: GGDEF domain-containing protein [Lachnospirales bacterium]